MVYHHYKKYLKPYAQTLRANSTKAEIDMWTGLLSKGKMRGFTFNRQKPLGPYIYDFYCKKLNLVIELDGSTHESDDVIENDKEKDIYARSIGLEIIRFTNADILEGAEEVQRTLEQWIDHYVTENHIQPRNRIKKGSP